MAVQLLCPARDVVASRLVVDAGYLEEFGDERGAVLSHTAVYLHVGHGGASFVECAMPRRYVHVRGGDQGAVHIQKQGAAAGAGVRISHASTVPARAGEDNRWRGTGGARTLGA